MADGGGAAPRGARRLPARPASPRPLHAPALLVALLGMLAAGCVADPPTITPAPPTQDLRARVTPDAGTATFRMDPLNTELGLGFERFAFRLYNETGAEITDADVTVVFYSVSATTQEAVRKASGKALYFGGELPVGGQWVVYTELDVSGPWALDVTADLPTGDRGLATANVIVEGRTDTPYQGQPVPDGDTPSLGAGTPLERLTTDPEPDERLYALSVAEAIQTRLPTVVLFASPAHCADEGCAATLRALRTVAAQYEGRVNFVHVESRDPNEPSEMSAAAKAWGLESDPWTFFLGARGFVAARIEGPVGVDELKLMVDRTIEAP